ncbi:hypothetical protein VSDG_03127 [Cytospora chrysosperma]|uniref:Cell wall protein SED1 n=1 Tax=Cytospora chrysosperma TaxID=252740 RepID=A0A423W8G5_CYTCH|nr:hypothetical protein VSDG_03127 [Valsa sordida]
MQARKALFTLGAATLATAQSYGSHVANATTTAILVVDSFTTWCPKATVLTYEHEYYTATEPTMLTVTNCPCTITTTGAAYAINNATMTTGGKEATSEATVTGKTSAESSSAGESGAAGAAGGGGAAETTGESGAAATTKSGSEAAAPTFAQSGAAGTYASIHLGLAAVFASVFVFGY